MTSCVISDQLWSSWFGRDPSVIGKSYFVSDSMKQIIGVMPPEFSFPSDETHALGRRARFGPRTCSPGRVGDADGRAA